MQDDKNRQGFILTHDEILQVDGDQLCTFRPYSDANEIFSAGAALLDIYAAYEPTSMFPGGSSQRSEGIARKKAMEDLAGEMMSVTRPYVKIDFDEIEKTLKSESE